MRRVARSITNPDRRAQALTAVAGALTRAGQHEQAATVARVVLRVGEGAGVDLRGQGGQVLPPGARLGRGDQDVIGGGPALARDLVGPAADGPGHRLGQHGALGQRRRDLRVRQHAAGPAQVTAGCALGHPGAVDQPGGGTVVGVLGVARR